MSTEMWAAIVIAIVALAVIIRASAALKPKAVTKFADLDVGSHFFLAGHRFRKIEESPIGHNALSIGERRFTEHFDADQIVTVPTPMPRPSWWRRWLLHRSLVWATYGHSTKAKIAWRVARSLATENTHAACAAYCGQLLMLGDE